MAAGICSSLVAPEMKTKSFNKQKNHKTGLVGTVTNGFMTHRQPYSGVHRIWKTQAQLQYKNQPHLGNSCFEPVLS